MQNIRKAGFNWIRFFVGHSFARQTCAQLFINSRKRKSLIKVKTKTQIFYLFFHLFAGARFGSFSAHEPINRGDCLFVFISRLNQNPRLGASAFRGKWRNCITLHALLHTRTISRQPTVRCGLRCTFSTCFLFSPRAINNCTFAEQSSRCYRPHRGVSYYNGNPMSCHLRRVTG